MKNKAKKWLLSTVALVLFFVIILSSLVYVVDPFFQFRVKDNSYMLNGRFLSGGLIKNYDYDTLILGSSMTQNFDMDVFREELGAKPLHIGIGGIRPTEEFQLLNLAYETGKADTFYICAEPHLFTADSEESRIPKYLTNDDVLSRVRYFLNYEAWFRYIPIDIGFMILDKVGIAQPEKFVFSKSIDRLEDWRLDFDFGEDIVIRNYKSEQYNVSSFDTENLYEKMTARIDEYYEHLQLDKGEHIFFYAPYSMFYWANYDDEMVSVLLASKKYFALKAFEKGIKVYDFQSADFTKDLNNYRDYTHYSPQINDWMVKCFATGENLVNYHNYDEFENKLIEMRKQFIIDKQELFQ